MDDLPFGSPDTRRQLGALESTPQIGQRAQGVISDDLYTPGSIDYHRALFVTQERHKRDEKKEEIVRASKAKALQAKIAAELQEEAEENQRQIEVLTLKIRTLTTNLDGIKSDKSDAEREIGRAAEAAKLLTERVAALESEQEKMRKAAEEERIEAARLIREQEDEAARQIDEEKLNAARLVDAERILAAEQIALKQAEMQRLIDAEKDEAARQIALKQDEMQRLVDEEKAKKTKIMAASREALDAMDKRLAESKRQMIVLAEERDELVSTSELLKTREVGLKKQIEVFNRHLEETVGSVRSDASGFNGITLGARDPAVLSTPLSMGVGGSGGHSAASVRSNVALPKANFKPTPQ